MPVTDHSICEYISYSTV